MKTVAYTCLHYGRDYLGAAIRSVIDHVDEYHVIYTAKGSHGHRTDIQCPESRDELYLIAAAAAGDKLRWHEGEWLWEGQQREMIFQYAPDADVILALDADEIWSPGLAKNLIEFAKYGDQSTEPRCNWRVPMIHYWRSLNRAVLHDPAFPVRLILPHGKYILASQLDPAYPVPYSRSEETMPRGFGVINHMGYAQRSEIVGYKLLTHGHRGEFRRDCDWFNDVFMTNRQHDCHPVGSEYWNPEAVNPLDYLPAWMADHPYFGMEVIP